MLHGVECEAPALLCIENCTGDCGDVINVNGGRCDSGKLRRAAYRVTCLISLPYVLGTAQG